MAYKKYFTLSFDDGVEQDKQIIALMKQYGLRGTFNLNAGMFGHKPRFVNIRRIPKDEIKQVYEGFEVASHGYKHEFFRFLSQSKTEESLKRDINELSALTGVPIMGHAYPYDAHTPAAENFLRSQGVIYARKVRGKGSFLFPENPFQYVPTCWFNTKKVFETIDSFLQAQPENNNLLFTMWGHGYEMDYGLRKCPKEQLERIFSHIAGHSDITYCTMQEAFAEHNQQLVKSYG